jgi:hypothetical protein
MGARFAIFLLLPQLLAGPAAAADLTVSGWDRARWGMTDAELGAAYEGRLRILPVPFDFDGAYAALTLPDIELAGSRFTALFQMERTTGRLRQVLVERRRHYATIALFRRLEAELARRHGPPCRRRDAPGEPRDNAIAVLERSWVVPAGAIHLTFLNFRNDIPKRLVLRYHGRGRGDLMAARAPGDATGFDQCPAS